MGIWRRLWRQEEPYVEVGQTPDSKQQEAQLKHELNRLLQQRQTLEQRGCFSDRELAVKDHELEQIDQRVRDIKGLLFRVRTQSRIHI